MKVTYRGVNEQLSEKLQSKLDTKFAKLSKLLEKRGEKEAHVVVTKERHLLNAEVTLQFYDHQLVGDGSDGDLFTAVSTAIDKLEIQAVKTRGKWREKARRSNGHGPAASLRSAKTKEAPEMVVAAPAKIAGKRVNKVNHLNRRKPMTLEEAVIEMEGGRDYVVYRDADRECLSVLVRRKDGNYDLIES